MTENISEVNTPEPTDSQLARTEQLLDTFGNLIDLGNFKAYENAFLQILSDVATVDRLHEEGIEPDQPFVISHSATFRSKQDAQRYEKLVNYSGYLVRSVENNLIEKLFNVLFQHSGTLAMDDILAHTMLLDKSATSMNGDYEGWEVVMDDDS